MQGLVSTPTRRGVLFCDEKDFGTKLVGAFGGVESPEGDGPYGSPPGPYFCMRKSRQNALGAVPQDPLAAKLRLDTNDALASSVRRRRYALKVPAAHFCGVQQKPN